MLPRTTGGLAIAILTLLAAGCGASTTTVTGRRPLAVASKLAATHRSPAKRTVPGRVCTAHVTVNAHASCGFAANVLSAFAGATHEENGVTYLGVESPVTDRTYAVACTSAGYHRVGCTAKNARVTFGWDEVETARNHRASQAQAQVGLWGGQTRQENEEAGCKYGFTASPRGTKCDTQEEGQRIQESFRREREDPQREAENNAITEEDRSREECDVRLGVVACQ